MYWQFTYNCIYMYRVVMHGLPSEEQRLSLHAILGFVPLCLRGCMILLVSSGCEII